MVSSSSPPPEDPQTLPTSPPLCPHLSLLRSNPDQISSRLPSNPRPCTVCHKIPPRILSCISCGHVACLDHAPPHAEETAHTLAADIERNELYCCICNDHVYSRDFDDIFIKALSVESPEKAKKRRRVDFKLWSPDSGERQLIAANTTPIAERRRGADGEEVPLGLRGLSNLGSTCFMNSVLQALIHNPPLRSYFLGDMHNKLNCQRENKTIVTRQSEASTSSGGKKGSGSGKKKGAAIVEDQPLCVVCDLDAIYKAAFSEKTKPFSPAKLLYSSWKHASNLASYEQQDAHEFFITMLGAIHDKLQKDKRKSFTSGTMDCCIAHRVFSGSLRSDVTCISCGYSSVKTDPCIDISLDLEPNHTDHGKPTSSKSNSSVNNEVDPISTLTGCLDRFTRAEKLGADQKFFCPKCKTMQESIKQMSIGTLPLVCCFHIKRFEHCHIDNMARKIDRYLQFPFVLDMTPYVSSSVLRQSYGRMFPNEADLKAGSSDSSFEFDLFAVITHSGSLHAGHYVTYLRLSGDWYKCDDAWITRVNDDIVRSAQGYMMFYVQKMYSYGASETAGASS